MDGQDFDRLARFLGSGRSRRGVLKALGGVALGVVGVSASSRGAVAKNDKVGICHVDGQGRFRHITVSSNAVNAHLAHGDYTADITSDVNNCGACGNTCDDGDACTTNSCVDGVCEYANVPVDCVVDWSDDWGSCSAECGGGTQTRTGTITTEASCNGAACPESLEETRACNTQACEEQCDADLMSDPANCGTCGNSCNDGDMCTENSCVNGTCVSQPVEPVDCVLEWEEWPPCRCPEGGQQQRFQRVAIRASCGGQACPSPEREIRFCPVVDTTSDEANCGACGNVCASGEVCENGRCIDNNNPRG